MVPADKKRMLIKSARQHNTGFANRCVSALQFGPCGAKRGFWSEVQPPVHHNFSFKPVHTCHAHRQYLEMQRRQMVCFLHNFKSHLTQLLKARFCYEKLNFNPIIKSKIPKVVYISEAVRWCKFIIRQKRCAQELIISIFMFQLSEPFSFLGDTPYIYC